MNISFHIIRSDEYDEQEDDNTDNDDDDDDNQPEDLHTSSLSFTIEMNAAIEEVKTSSAPRHSRAKVRTWYQLHVKRVLDEGGKSSRDDDLDAAREYFGISISRGFMRELRREFAPESWKSKGAPRRKS